MKGTRPLDNDEIRRVSGCFTGTYEVRNRGLFMLGGSTGGRISELLSLRVGDVYQNRASSQGETCSTIALREQESEPQEG